MKRFIFNLVRVVALEVAFCHQPAIAQAPFITFTNPTPEYYDEFGWSVAVMGTDRVLVGAPEGILGASGAGAAYLFSTNGTLLTTFTNPIPNASGMFGYSLAAVGTDRVLIGVPYDDTGAASAGVAYLFSGGGVLLHTFTNPEPVNYADFGFSLAALGETHVAIGAPGVNKVYLFTTEGTWLTVLTNPPPDASTDRFGGTVAALGSDRVIVGANQDNTGASFAGAAYLFATNGALLTTFTNPTPQPDDFFGLAIAAVGSDQILVGAPGDLTTNGFPLGAAYLFSTNGALLLTITNPTPVFGELFGGSVAGVGSDRVLIGDINDSTLNPHGVVYLISTSGALLATFTNPAAMYDHFSNPVAAAGTAWMVTGAPQNNTGAYSAGLAHLFSLEEFTDQAPLLSIALDPQLSILTLSWPAPGEGWVLECTNSVPSGAIASWSQVPPPYQTNAETISVTFTNPSPTDSRFFRLHKP